MLLFYHKADVRHPTLKRHLANLRAFWQSFDG
jgi:hypothetical protein